MRSRIFGEHGRGSAILIGVVLVIGLALAAWKVAGARAAALAAYSQPEPVEAVTTAVAEAQPGRPLGIDDDGLTRRVEGIFADQAIVAQ